MISRIFRSDRHSAVLLLSAAVLGLLLANSAIGPALIELSHRDLGMLSISHWISDLLLVVFFVIVAAELKYELTHGQLNTTRKALVPAIAALGGVLIPALLYLVVAGPDLARGWPIPTATDIAFALGVLAVFGRGLPGRLRVFLLALAVLDDLVGILFIAIIFTANVSIPALLGGVACIVALAVASRMRHRAPRALTVVMIILAIAAWYLVLLSGVHATIAGVALALLVPAQPIRGREVLHILEDRLHNVSAFVIVPLFALANAGIVLGADTLRAAVEGDVAFAIAAALVLGKLLGISGAIFAVTRLGIARLPEGVRPAQVWGLAALGGIGFTVSLFIAQLAYDDAALVDEAKLGILAGSLASGVLGAAILVVAGGRRR